MGGVGLATVALCARLLLFPSFLGTWVLVENQSETVTHTFGSFGRWEYQETWGGGHHLNGTWAVRGGAVHIHVPAEQFGDYFRRYGVVVPAGGMDLVWEYRVSRDGQQLALEGEDPAGLLSDVNSQAGILSAGGADAMAALGQTLRRRPVRCVMERSRF